MCGRYGLKVSFSTLAKILGAKPVSDDDWGPDLNIAPTDPAPVLLAGEDGGARLDLFRWGLVPFWAKSAREGARMINARAETVADKPAFREALAKRRLLVPASGWYEWTHAPAEAGGAGGASDEGGKGRAGKKAAAPKPEPHWIHPAPGPGGAPGAEQLVLFAGLWASWKDPATGESRRTFSVVTTDAAPSTRAVHDRMPVVLTPEGQAAWLDPQTPVEALRGLLVPYPGPLVHHRVSAAVNSVRADGPELIAPIGGDAGAAPAAKASQGRLGF